MSDERRLCVVSIPADILPLVLRGLTWTADIPADAVHVRACYDFPSDAFLLVLQHPSFDPVDPNAEPPRRYPRFLRYF